MKSFITYYLLYLTFLPNMLGENSYRLLGVVVIYWFSVLSISLYKFRILGIHSTFSWLVWLFPSFWLLQPLQILSRLFFCMIFGTYFRISVVYTSVHEIVGSRAYLTLVDTFNFPSDYDN